MTDRSARSTRVHSGRRRRAGRSHYPARGRSQRSDARHPIGTTPSPPPTFRRISSAISRPGGGRGSWRSTTRSTSPPATPRARRFATRSAPPRPGSRRFAPWRSCRGRAGSARRRAVCADQPRAQLCAVPAARGDSDGAACRHRDRRGLFGRIRVFAPQPARLAALRRRQRARGAWSASCRRSLPSSCC